MIGDEAAHFLKVSLLLVSWINYIMPSIDTGLRGH